PINDEVWAPRCKVMYTFPGNERTAGDVLPLTWYDGEGHKPDRDAFDLPTEYRLPGAGSVVVGEEGTLVIPHMGEPQLFPQEKFADYDVPQLEDVNHYLSWVDACLGTGETTSSFEYAGPLTEAVLLGAVGIFYPGEELKWDA